MRRIILIVTVVASVFLLSSCSGGCGGGCNTAPTDGCCGATSSGIWY